MNRSELIATLSKKMPGLSPGATEAAVTCILSHMTTALTHGQRIEIRGFGSFALHLKPPRTGRNPKTGEHLQLPAKATVHFKPGKDLKDRANNTAPLLGHNPAP